MPGFLQDLEDQEDTLGNIDNTRTDEQNLSFDKIHSLRQGRPVQRGTDRSIGKLDRTKDIIGLETYKVNEAITLDDFDAKLMGLKT